MCLSPFDKNDDYYHRVHLGAGFLETRFHPLSTYSACEVFQTVLTRSRRSAYRYYAELIDQYGPVVSLRHGTRFVCLIGRYQVCTMCTGKPRVVN